MRQRNEIKPCPNPQHKFTIGRLLGIWQWASDCWAILDRDNQTRVHWLHLGRVYNPEFDMDLYEFVLGKFRVAVSWMDTKK